MLLKHIIYPDQKIKTASSYQDLHCLSCYVQGDKLGNFYRTPPEAECIHLNSFTATGDNNRLSQTA